MNKNFERELPDGYKQVYHLNATDKKIGIIFTLGSFIPFIILLPIAIILINANGGFGEFNFLMFEIATFGIGIILLAYMVLHELTHGIVYKAMTKETLKFGLSWSCAYCGVPNIFVYRKTAILALIMPFVVFSIIFIPATIALFFVHSYLFIGAIIILSLHLGGCIGDLYDLYLYLFKYKDPSTLMKDTGPEQFFYVKEVHENL